MLHFIIGTAGTGKTTRLLEEIRKSVESGRRAILLIPEQYSFANERLSYRMLGPRLSLSVETLSFTRLCDNIFRKFGGLSGVELTDTARYLLMSVVLEELAPELSVYRKSSSNIAFLDTVLSACSEFKTAGVTPSRLSEFSQSCGNTHLSGKIGELAMLYGAYQALLDMRYKDPEDSLIRACGALSGHDYFDGYDVFIDGFTAFMAGETDLLGHIITQADNVWFAMTADSLHDGDGETGVFSPAKSAMQQFMRIAKSNGVTVATPELLDVPRRYKTEALGHLSKNFFSSEPAAAEEETGYSGITVTSASDIYEEAVFAAARISALVENGVRYNEIAVIARDTSGYMRAVELAFERFGIPYFADDPEDIENKSLTAGILSAIDAVSGNYDAESVLALAKSPIMGFLTTDVAALEDYAYIWGVRGEVWFGEFANSPRGLAEELSEDDVVNLEKINNIRRRLAEPLIKLREAVRTGSSKAFAAGVYNFLMEVGAADNLSAYSEQMEQGERETFLDENARLWDIICEVLDIFGSVLVDMRMPWIRLCELLRLAAGTASIGMPPQTLDQVIIGMADRIRPGEMKAVFILGANEGVFPPTVMSGGAFSDDERTLMIDAGIRISPPCLGKVGLERYYAYFSLTIPSESLFVSYPRSDLQGRELLPSAIVTTVREMFPSMPTDDKPETLSMITNAKSAFALYGRICGSDGEFAASLRAYLINNGYADRIAAMETAAAKPPHILRAEAAARRLFGERMRLSPSSVERYYKCPFSFFAKDGLKLKKRSKVEFSLLESGSVMHYVLQVIFQRHGGKGISRLGMKELEDEISAIISEYISSRVEDASALPARFRYLLRRLCGTLARLAAHMGREFAQSKFDPAEFELPIMIGEKTEPLELVTEGGTRVTVEGVVDRVDIMTAQNGSKYVRVVDYKSGRKDFKLQDILCGLNLQMLLYLFTITENGMGGESGMGESRLIPAGVLYMPVRENYVQAGREDSDGDIMSQRMKSWRMSGILLDDAEALEGMEEGVSGIFIPAKRKKDGALDSKSSVADLASMGRLAARVKEQVAGMADALLNGRIEAYPVDAADYKPCAFCDYRTVCGFESGDAVKQIAKLDREEVLNILAKGEHDESKLD